MSKYAELTEACGGSLNPETLTDLGTKIKADPDNFDDAVRLQYMRFMYEGSLMFAPIDLERETKLEMALEHVSELMEDSQSCQDDSAEDAIRAEIYDVIGKALRS